MENTHRVLKLAFIISIILGIAFGTGWLCGYNRGARSCKSDFAEVDHTVTADTVRDTIFTSAPVARATKTAGTKRVTVSVAADERGDTTSGTIEIDLPLTLTEYGDSTYRAWVSGYMATLDSIEVYQKTVTVTEKITLRERKKWGFTIGPSVGVGWTGEKFSPMVGVSLTYGFSF